MVLGNTSFMTKVFSPRRREDILHRPRLVNFIHEHIDRRLLLVCAPAGFGKTTLLIDFAADSDLPVCWYSIDESDGDPRVFLEYLIAAINHRFPDFGQQTLSLLQSVGDVSRDINSIVGSLVNEILTIIPGYFVLVLDDFHLVDSSKSVLGVLDLLLRYLPDNCHIVISSRTIPSLTLTRLAAHRQVAGIGITDLRFNSDEIKQFMSQNHKLLLTDPQADEITSQSEGWITGIVLTTHTMWRGLFESIIRAKKSSGPLFDYLASEVFDQQGEEIKNFLLSSSILSTMSPDICDQLLERNDSSDILELLEESNLFTIRLEGEDRWYRYHQLFQQFLQERLLLDMPDRFLSLHARAATLFEARGNFQTAIEHSLAADLQDEAARIIESAAEAEINDGRFETVQGWLNSLSENQVKSRPRLLVHAGRVAIRNGDLDAAIEILRVDPEWIANEAGRPQAAEILVRRSTALRMKGKITDAKSASREALRLAPQVTQIAAAAHQDLGICQCIEGDFSSGIKDLEYSLQLYETAADRYKVASLHHDLGEAYTTIGDLKRAASHYAEALSEWERTGNAGSGAFTSNSIGVLYHIQGETALALETLENALHKAREAGNLRAVTYILASLSDVYRDLSRFDEAIEAGLQALEMARQIDEATLIVYCLDAVGNIRSLTGEHTKGELMIRQALQLAENRQSSYGTGICKASLGRLHARRDEFQLSISLLAEARSLLERAQAKRDLARASLFSAYSLFRLNRQGEAMEDLDYSLKLAEELGVSYVLAASAQEVLPLITYARKVRRDNKILEEMLKTASTHTERPNIATNPVAGLHIAKATRQRLRAFALGQSRVLKSEEFVTSSEWAVEKTKEMFFFLALTHPRGYQKEQIIEALWPEIDDSKGNSQFHSTVYRLRRALFPEVLVFENGLYKLNLEDEDWLDVREFEQTLAAARRYPRESPAAMANFERAVELYEGPLLEDIYSDWIEDYRARCEKEYLDALQEMASICAEKGDTRAAIRYCQKALSIDNYREEIHLQLVEFYALAGDRVQAAKHFKRYEEFLKKELGVGPSAQILAKFERLLFRD